MDIDTDTGAVGRREEREALHVIHVEMAHQQVELGDALALERGAELADAGAGVENEDARSAANFDAGGVAAAAQGRWTGRRDRTSSAPEFDREERNLPQKASVRNEFTIAPSSSVRDGARDKLTFMRPVCVLSAPQNAVRTPLPPEHATRWCCPKHDAALEPHYMFRMDESSDR